MCIRDSTYCIGTFFGIIPGTFAFTFLGVGLQSIIDQQRSEQEACLQNQPEAACGFDFSPADLVTVEMLLAFTALGVVALIPIVLRKWRERSNQRGTQ